MEYNNRKESTEYYYVDLDTLFDVKLTIMSIGFNKFYNEYMKKEDYWKRKTDNFICGNTILDNDMFEVLYNRRNKDILRNSHLTAIPYILSKQIQSHYRELDCARCLNKPGIIINTYPYYLENSELESLKLIFKVYMDIPIDIKFIHYSYKDLNLGVLFENNICSLIMNNGLEWIETLDKHIMLHTNLRDLKIITPKLLNSKLEPIEENFKAIEEIYSKIFDFEYLEAKYFSYSLNPGEEEITGDIIEKIKNDPDYKEELEKEIKKVFSTSVE